LSFNGDMSGSGQSYAKLTNAIAAVGISEPLDSCEHDGHAEVVNDECDAHEAKLLQVG
jgi:hypothetical protein